MSGLDGDETPGSRQDWRHDPHLARRAFASERQGEIVIRHAGQPCRLRIIANDTPILTP
ncbi:hemin uptake protein HemP [Methylobacterium pseudosasicola]|uniref:Hemin uptake protein HemP n=1 Tax=Methylobacterium pseudosasicola TaxID=582667 RepID=A0A1I4HD04_9HYPH|nr:hemin uptake protein HemP [Methylobacterium pseudosasicola]SFL40179.1 hypothetical protein SAMN05192568_1004179 [Methylobacterium pseudosasicola]